MSTDVIDPFLICDPVIRLRTVPLDAALATMSDAATAIARMPFLPMLPPPPFRDLELFVVDPPVGQTGRKVGVVSSTRHPRDG